MTWRTVVQRLRIPWIDAGIAALFVCVMAIEVRANDWQDGPWLISAMALLAWRRSFPTTVASLLVVVTLLVDVDGQTTAILAIPLAAFTIGTELPPARALRSLAVLVAVTVIALVSGHWGSIPPSDVAALLVFCVGPVLVGMTLHQRMQAEAEAKARAARAEEQALVAAERAADRERERIARELHDIVSHSLTVVTINAQAVRRSLDPEQTRQSEALAAVEQTAREAGVEMRRLFGVLRQHQDADALHPQPGLAQLPVLVERCAAAGLPVHVEVDDSLRLSGGVDVTAYRIVQEALTNVLRHADATTATVRISGGRHQVEVEVEDDGVGGSPGAGGHGLVGIRERAHVYGGSAEAHDTGHGFRVRVLLPVGDAS